MLSVPKLAPNETYERDVEIDLSDVTRGEAPCPIVITATIDFGSQIDELDEQNNIAEYEVCCE